MISSFLFKKNLNDIITLGIEVTKLFESNVFQMEFDFDEWPSTHTNNDKYIRPYNGSIFDLRGSYDKIFLEKEFAPINEAESDEKIDTSKIYKIKYTLQLLTDFSMHVEEFPLGSGNKQVIQRDTHLIDTLEHSDELDIFNTDLIKNFIEFKWDHVGKRHH